MRIKQARLTIEELHELKWLVGGVLAFLSLWALGSLELESGFYIFVASIAVFVALIGPQWIASIPPVVWRIAGPVILLVTIVDFAFGDTHFFPPLMRMVILLLLYRTLAPRTRREDLQLVLLCLFSVVVSGALTVSFLFAAQILLFTPVAMALLFVICLLDRGPEAVIYQPSWEHFSWRRLVPRVWRVVDVRVLAFGALLFVFVVSASTCLFVLIPRFNLEQAIPFLQLQAKTMSGFSDEVKIGSVAEIIEDHSIALQVDVPSIEAISSKPYWRILVLDQYHDGAFRLSPQIRELRQPDRVRSLSAWGGWQPSQRHRKAEQWTFFFEGGVSQYLPLPGAFHSMRFPTKQDVVLFPDLHVLGLAAVPQNTFSYQIEDLLWDVRAPASSTENLAFSEFSGDFEIKEEEDIKYPLTTLELNMDLSDRKRLTELNNLLIGEAVDLSAADYSERVTSHLRGNFGYSLKSSVTDNGGDPVVGWLAEGSLGHCELFAGAFVLLARDAGYPARMAVGFVGGGWNAVEDFFVVRNSDAHAWVEIYDAATQEWLRVDPTPGASPNDPELSLPASFDVETGMGAWVDGLRMQWYRRVVNFDENDQVELATSIIDLGDELIEEISARLKAIGTALKVWIMQPFNSASLVRGGVFAFLCFGCFGLWRTRFYWLHLLFRLLRRPQALNPIRKEAARHLVRLRVQLEESDANAPHTDTLREVRGELEALRFGPEVPLHTARTVFTKTKRILKLARA